MRRTNAELILKNSLKFTQSCLNGNSSTSPAVLASSSSTAGELPDHISSINYDDDEIKDFPINEDCFGGIIKKGQLGWLARGPLFEVFSLKSGKKISSFRFDLNLGFERCIVTCVAEIDVAELNFCILAICMQFTDAPGGLIVLCSVQELSKIFRCIEIKEKITSCHYVRKEITKRTILQMFNGCLAIGTDNGNVILLDLNLRKCEQALFSGEKDEDDIELIPCYIVDCSLDFHELSQHFQRSKLENLHFGIQLDVVEDSSFILSIIPIVNILSLAVGLEDGRLLLFDLSELQILYILKPPVQLPLVKLTYIEPADDPRPCIYLWAFHEGNEPSTALMYSIMYEKRLMEDDGICIFENFQSCSLRLTLNTSDKCGIPIACQSIFKQSTNNYDENTISLCLLAWKQQNGITQLLLFDMNQWYKEQMPHHGNSDGSDNYLVSFTLKDCNALDMYIDPNSVTPFNSLQRPEEHFYPISLNFDCIILHQNGSSHLNWPGLQNRALELLKSGGALAILEPTPYFDEIIRASLLPQFCGTKRNYDYRRLSSQSQYSDDGIMDTSALLQNYNSMFSINDQRNILLSVALEYNCFGLLKECAICWADGSHLGNRPYEGLSLSTLTEWIWKRANAVKKRCNTLCVPLFDHSGLKIDQRSKKELSHLLRQLKLLADLMEIILKRCREYIPNDVFEILSSQHQSIRLASNYQEVVHWLLNVGLLPEGIPIPNNASDISKETLWSMNLVPYPYKVLRNFYSMKRKRLGQVNKSAICERTGSCRILYIDSFIEHECKVNMLRDDWIECDGNGLYPPPSLQAMLRVLLIPDIPLENKYVLFIYLFLDLNTFVECERHADIVQNLVKFPAVFKLNASLIKTVQAFWNLDHGEFETALKELISPFSQDRKLSQWQKELLVETLLTQDQPNLALRALQIPSIPMSALLELKTLLANDLVAEAFHLQRAKNDPQLFRQFLTGCQYLGKLSVLRDLAFTEDESKILEEFLRNDARSSKAENLHFVYLLEKSKYIEAMSYLDELSNNKQNQQQKYRHLIDLETPNLVLSAYNSTMTPASKELADCYYGIRTKIRPNDMTITDPLPLSSQLFQQNANKLTGGIYHSSILSTDQATIYWDEDLYKEKNRLLDANNAAFIRAPQSDIVPFEIGSICDGSISKDSISYPEVYKSTQKRRLLDGTHDDDTLDDHISSENPQKRRRILETPTSMQNHTSQNINTSLLTKFKEKSNYRNYNYDTECTGVEKITNNNSTTMSRQNSVNKNSTNTILSTPIVKSSRLDLLRNDDDDDRVSTPQSILKGKSRSTRTPVKSYVKRRLNIQDGNTRNREKVFTYDEKNLRFELPESQSSSRSLSHQEFSLPTVTLSSYKKDEFIIDNESDKVEVISEERKEDCNDDKGQYSTTILKNRSQLYSGPQKRKPLRRSDASEGDNLLSTSLESNEDDYHSVQSSRNVSKISEKDLSDDKQEENLLWGETPKSPEGEEEQLYSSKKPNIKCNPKARRPINRTKLTDTVVQISTSRHRSKTPDRTVFLPSRKSERLQSKMQQADDQIHQDKPQPSSSKVETLQESYKPQQRKPLSRMLLEGNIRKNTYEAIERNTMKMVSKQSNIEENTFTVSQTCAANIEDNVITFLPVASSSKFFESSTPIQFNTKKLLENISSSVIDVDTTISRHDDSKSLNISSEYSSIAEKSFEKNENEQTIVNTAIESEVIKTKTITATTIVPTFTGDSGVRREHRTQDIFDTDDDESNSMVIADDTESSENKLPLEEFNSPRSFKVSIENVNDEVEDDKYEEDKESSSSSSMTDDEKMNNEQFSVKCNDDEVVCISSDSSSVDRGLHNVSYETEYFEDTTCEGIAEYYQDKLDQVKSLNPFIRFYDDDYDGDHNNLKETDTNITSVYTKVSIEDQNNEKWNLDSPTSINENVEKSSTQNESEEMKIDDKVQQVSNEDQQAEMNLITNEKEEMKKSLHLVVYSEEDESNVNIEHEKKSEEEPINSEEHLKENDAENNLKVDDKNEEVCNDGKVSEVNIQPESDDLSSNQKQNKIDKVDTMPENKDFQLTVSSSSNEMIKLKTLEKTEHEPSTSSQDDQVSSAKKRKLFSEQEIEKLSDSIGTPTRKVLKGRRARSVSIDIESRDLLINQKREEEINSPVPDRLTRAKSVSTDTPPLTPTRILTRRRSALLNRIEEDSVLQSPSRSITPTTPNRVLTRRQSALLNCIEEGAALESSRRSVTPTTPSRSVTKRQPAVLDPIQEDTVSESPLPRTRSLKRLNMADSEVERTPINKRTRRSSVDFTEVSDSASRTVRGKSILTEDNYQTPKKGEASTSKAYDKKESNKIKSRKSEILERDSSGEDDDDLEVKKQQKGQKEKSVEPEKRKKNVPKIRANVVEKEDGRENQDEEKETKVKPSKKKEKSIEPENKKITSTLRSESKEKEKEDQKKTRPKMKEKSVEPEMKTPKKKAGDGNKTMSMTNKDVEDARHKKEKSVESTKSTGRRGKVIEKNDEADESITISDSDDEDVDTNDNKQKSKKTATVKRRQSEDVQTSEQSMKDENEYSTSRRLTRGQRAIVEIQKLSITSLEPHQLESPSRRRSTRSEEKSTRDSETESVTSTKSKRSLSSKAGVRRKTRNNSVKDDDDDNDDASSVGSASTQNTNKSGGRKSARSKVKNLKTIEEETKSDNESLASHDDSTEVNQPSEKKKGRPRKT